MADVNIQQPPPPPPQQAAPQPAAGRSGGSSAGWFVAVLILLGIIAWFVFGGGISGFHRSSTYRADVHISGPGGASGGNVAPNGAPAPSGGATGGGTSGGGSPAPPKTP
ncbi:MAG: hypothetical protein ACREPM_07160 [Gemmatimonadaceae bacterium]